MASVLREIYGLSPRGDGITVTDLCVDMILWNTDAVVSTHLVRDGLEFNSHKHSCEGSCDSSEERFVVLWEPVVQFDLIEEVTGRAGRCPHQDRDSDRDGISPPVSDPSFRWPGPSEASPSHCPSDQGSSRGLARAAPLLPGWQVLRPLCGLLPGWGGPSPV
ncbi:hypothetical protein H8959_015017 [Pygathrix nigripes]